MEDKVLKRSRGIHSFKRISGLKRLRKFNKNVFKTKHPIKSRSYQFYDYDGQLIYKNTLPSRFLEFRHSSINHSKETVFFSILFSRTKPLRRKRNKNRKKITLKSSYSRMGRRNFNK